ncbi:hypothetical protein T492DRAFT_1084191 [Pavlovales sp. CCMP2436]|nr:hypothetical protein T492DRAFT_1084191 [Pavlovales sp. CCMP2436]
MASRPGAARGPPAKYAPSSTQFSIAPPRAGDRHKIAIDKREGDKLGMRFAKDLVDGRFLLLEAVAPGSLADQHGMQVGDLVDSINGTKYTDTLSAVKALREAKGGLDIMLSPRNSAAGEAMGRAGSFKRPVKQPREPQGELLVMHKREGDKLGMRFAKDLVDGRFLLLEEVAPGSLAAKNGMKAGDLIDSINGTKYTDSVSAVKALRETQGGLEIMLSPRNRAAGEAMGRAGSFKRPAQPLMLNLNKRDGDKLGIRFGEELVDGKYLQIEEVAEGSLAAQNGIKPGDLVEAVNGMAAMDPLKAAEKLRNTKGEINLLMSPRNRSAAGAMERSDGSAAAQLKPRGPALSGAGAGAGGAPLRPAGMSPLALGKIGDEASGERVVLKKREGVRLGLRFAERKAGQLLLTVLEVLPGSVAEQVGLHVGDQVRSVNGAHSLTASRAAELMRDARGEIELVVAERYKEGDPLPAALVEGTYRAQPRGAAAAKSAATAAAAAAATTATASANSAALASDDDYFGLSGVVRRMSWRAAEGTGGALATLPADNAATPRGDGTARGDGAARGDGTARAGAVVQRREKRPSMFTNFLIRLDPNKLRAVVKLQAVARGFLDRLRTSRTRTEMQLTREYRERARGRRAEELAALTLQAGYHGWDARKVARFRRGVRDEARAAAKKKDDSTIKGLLRRASFSRGDKPGTPGSRPAYDGKSPSVAAGRASEDDMAAAVRKANNTSGGIANAPNSKVADKVADKPSWIDRQAGSLVGGIARRLSWRANDKPEEKPEPAVQPGLARRNSWRAREETKATKRAATAEDAAKAKAAADRYNVKPSDLVKPRSTQRY